MKFTEQQTFDLIRRLQRIYLESFPEDKESVEKFVRWAHRQFGYEYRDDKTNP